MFEFFALLYFRMKIALENIIYFFFATAMKMKVTLKRIIFLKF